MHNYSIEGVCKEGRRKKEEGRGKKEEGINFRFGLALSLCRRPRLILSRFLV
ncbi:hypothetical protein QUB60_02100 [Microcoleus sp. A2-C5]|uniref:hypothetical protein n=1 Tax=unclassified Microcoleus TaxID=2642155 RepID=UPI002FD354E2